MKKKIQKLWKLIIKIYPHITRGVIINNVHILASYCVDTSKGVLSERIF